MTDYKGGSGDYMRIRRLEAQRLKEKQENEEKLKKLQEGSKGLVSIDQKFAALSDKTEQVLSSNTYGLVSLEDFQKKRSQLEAEANKRAQQQPKVPKKPRIEKHKLSFAEDEEENQEEETVKEKPKKEEKEEENDFKKRKTLKNPDVDTTFLPDRERELEEQQIREELAKQWKEEQERIKNEEIEIAYSYWDGASRRKTAMIKKGWTISKFLDNARGDFKELRGVSVDQLMFIKEDMIIPHHLSFYDLVFMQARGKSGPLFIFGVKEDVRVVNDASVEKEESHAAKIVERRYYEKTKHLLPQSRWEIFDPMAIPKEEKYTSKG